MSHVEQHERHKKHRNVLYGIVVVLLILQIVSFLVISGQVSKLNSSLKREKAENIIAIENLSKYLINEIDSVRGRNQEAINEIALSLSNQQTDFDKQISLLKSSGGDFSGIVENAVKSVVSVGTDKSMGTGFIIDDEGYIITNEHVITGAKKIAVLTYDKQVISSELIGYDKIKDLALLKISGKYESLSLGDSSDVQVGEKVIAIGNPLGLSFSVTEGIVSAVKRPGPNGLEEYIQTDVSLNPGNSGGPLIDIQGNVIGVNNFKVGGAESLGFALESNIVREFANQIVNKTIV